MFKIMSHSEKTITLFDFVNRVKNIDFVDRTFWIDYSWVNYGGEDVEYISKRFHAYLLIFTTKGYPQVIDKIKINLDKEFSDITGIDMEITDSVKKWLDIASLWYKEESWYAHVDIYQEKIWSSSQFEFSTPTYIGWSYIFSGLGVWFDIAFTYKRNRDYTKEEVYIDSVWLWVDINELYKTYFPDCEKQYKSRPEPLGNINGWIRHGNIVKWLELQCKRKKLLFEYKGHNYIWNDRLGDIFVWNDDVQGYCEELALETRKDKKDYSKVPIISATEIDKIWLWLGV